MHSFVVFSCLKYVDRPLKLLAYHPSLWLDARLRLTCNCFETNLFSFPMEKMLTNTQLAQRKPELHNIERRFVSNQGPLQPCFHAVTVKWAIRQFKMSLGRQQRERQKKKLRFRLAKQKLSMCITLLCTCISLPSLHDYDMNCIISRFIDNVNIRR